MNFSLLTITKTLKVMKKQKNDNCAKLQCDDPQVFGNPHRRLGKV